MAADTGGLIEQDHLSIRQISRDPVWCVCAIESHQPLVGGIMDGKTSHVKIPSHWNELHRETPFVPSILHPTRLHFHDASGAKTVEWHSRRHRKGRDLIVREHDTKKRLSGHEREHSSLRSYKLWSWEFTNISWWVAQFFLWGSVAWVLNGFAVWLPSFHEKKRADDMARATAFIGGTIFLFGAVTAYVEALNIHPSVEGFRPSFYPRTKKTIPSDKTANSAVLSPKSEATSLPDNPLLEKGDTLDHAESAAAAVAASEKYAKRLSLREEKRRSRIVQQGQEQGQGDAAAPSPQSDHSSPSTPFSPLSLVTSPSEISIATDQQPAPSEPSAAASIPSPAPPTLEDSPIVRERAPSTVSESYNPPDNSSYIPSRHSSISSVGSASESYDSDFPDRVPTPTPPPSPPTSPPVQPFEDEPIPTRTYSLKGSRWREIGYIAAVIQLFAATVFWISVLTGLHHVLDENNVGEVQGLFWTPQVVGGMGFVFASILYMYEVQPKWYKLTPWNIGWQVGFWNLIGAIGFTLCGIFGYYAFANKFQEWGSAFSTFWGSWAFLIGSYVQLLEAINK